MNATINRFWSNSFLIAAIAFATIPVRAQAEPTEEELAKLAQNPVGNLISIPFQNNSNLNFGPRKGTQNVLNIQPVIPISVNDDWNIITRTILPVVSMPPLAPGDERTNGIGDLQFSAFLSPARPGDWIWGAGAVAQAATASSATITMAWAHRSWCCTWRKGVPGSTGC